MSNSKHFFDSRKRSSNETFLLNEDDPQSKHATMAAYFHTSGSVMIGERYGDEMIIIGHDELQALFQRCLDKGIITGMSTK